MHIILKNWKEAKREEPSAIERTAEPQKEENTEAEDTTNNPEKHYVEKEIKDISKNGFAIVLEMIMRKFQEEGKGPKELKDALIWHLTPEEAIANGINEYDI